MTNPRQTAVLKWAQGVSLRTCLLFGAGAIALQVVVLITMSQPLICECGTIRLWHGLVAGPENSQQLTDWYTYSHVIHGIGFYVLLLISPIAIQRACAERCTIRHRSPPRHGSSHCP